ncbi:MAG: hypothetical protein QOI66_4245 [Myxococcales bacterium]|jgi:PKD repeat protein|nr:hypothetical protein [Myxococcales bacterium]
MVRSRTPLLLIVMLWGVAVVGCRDRPGQGNADGSRDGVPFDVNASGDAITPLSLDFTATGCASFDLGTSRCSGPAPLTVTFSPIGSPSVTQFLWDFGDRTAMSSDRAPMHSYTLPGSFTVTLVGAGPSGSISRTRSQFIAVAVAGVGQLCDVDAQCAAGLRCLCGSAVDCGGAFVRGLCTVDCADGTCNGGALCSDLSLTGAPADPTAVPAPFQRALCVAACTDDSGCAPQLRCRDLPAPAVNASAVLRGWVRGCFAAVPADVGAACRTPDGTLSDAACNGGLCADLGALGVCSAACTATGAGCPGSSVCARFGDGHLRCLRTCTGAADCADDPLLACQPGADPVGALGFKLVVAGAGPTVCAPRACQTTDDCLPAGTCSDGHCRAR